MRKDMSDFGVCYQAGGRILAGETLYRASDGHLQFKYAPLSAVLYAPLTLLPRRTADAVWFAVILGLLLTCFALAYRALAPPRRSAAFLLGLSVLVLGKFIGREFILGQVNLLILSLILAALLAFQKGRDGQAGLLWALSLFFKPYALVFLPYFILKKRFRMAAAGLLTAAAGLALPALFYGWSGNGRILGEWVRTLRQSTAVLLEVGDNASLYAFLAKHLGPGALSTGLFLGLAALLALSVLWLLNTTRGGIAPYPETLDFAYLLVLVPLLSPLGWYYNYLYGLAAVVLVLNDFPRMSRLVAHHRRGQSHHHRRNAARSAGQDRLSLLYPPLPGRGQLPRRTGCPGLPASPRPRIAAAPSYQKAKYPLRPCFLYGILSVTLF